MEKELTSLSSSPPSKLRRVVRREDEDHNRRPESSQPLLPGLPDHIAQLCLYRLPPSVLYYACRRWRRLIYSPYFPPFPSLYALLSSPTTTGTGDPLLEFQSYDPVSATWKALPSPPPLPDPILLRHPAFLSRELPVQSLAVNDLLVVVAATATLRLLPAFSHPLVFDTSLRQWRFAPALHVPRRWCAAGAGAGVVYVASGIGGEYNPTVARSVERWNPTEDKWEKISSLPDGRFSREATTLVEAKGKMLMVNSMSNWARDGVLYDIAADRWEAMPPGMVEGWRGPAAALDDTIYTIEEQGLLRKYEWRRDTWVVLMKSTKLEGTVLIAAGGGRLCAVVDGGAAVAVVDVKRKRISTVDLPDGRQILAMHVLPRMSDPNQS